MIKLYRVSFPDVYVFAYDDEDLQDQVRSSVSNCDYEHDLKNYDVTQVTNEQQADSVDLEYIPHHQTSDLTIGEYLQVLPILQKLSNEESHILMKIINER